MFGKHYYFSIEFVPYCCTLIDVHNQTAEIRSDCIGLWFTPSSDRIHLQDSSINCQSIGPMCQIHELCCVILAQSDPIRTLPLICEVDN